MYSFDINQLNFINSIWFQLIYPFIANLLSIIAGAFLLVKLLKPYIVLSEVFVYNRIRNNDRFYYKFYNRSLLLNILEVKSSFQIAYTNTTGSRIFKKNLIVDQGALIKVNKRNPKSIKFNGNKYYCNSNSAWVRGIPLSRVVNQLKKINSFSTNPEIDFVLKITYKSELTGLQYSRSKKYRLADYSLVGKTYNEIKALIIDKLTKDGFFKLGPTVDISTPDQRNLEDRFQYIYRKNGIYYARNFIKNNA
ncbi:MAG: hypothetical protein KQI35_17220 [Bacteroidetes bacterium]|nr:hypothetical protein [Bacteroidota bacterium]